MKLRISGNDTASGSSMWLWCPGCEDSHRITVGADDAWSWNGDHEKPTISPSIFVHSHPTFDDQGQTVDTPDCHSFLVDGVWQFLADSTHRLAGQSVPMVDLPEWLTLFYDRDAFMRLNDVGQEVARGLTDQFDARIPAEARLAPVDLSVLTPEEIERARDAVRADIASDEEYLANPRCHDPELYRSKVENGKKALEQLA